MTEQDIKNITGEMIQAIKDSLGDKWDEARIFAESEAKKFALNIAEITLWKKTGKITEEQGKVLLRMHQRSIKMVLTALEGISLVLAERAINAAVAAVAGIVNRLIGWDLF